MGLALAALMYMRMHERVVGLDRKATKLRSAGKYSEAEGVLTELARERHYQLRLGAVEVHSNAVEEALDGYEYTYEEEWRDAPDWVRQMNYEQVNMLLHELGKWLSVSPNPHEWLRFLLSHLNEHQLVLVLTVVEELMEAKGAS